MSARNKLAEEAALMMGAPPCGHPSEDRAQVTPWEMYEYESIFNDQTFYAQFECARCSRRWFEYQIRPRTPAPPREKWWRR